MTQKSSEPDVFLILRKNVNAKAVPEIGRFDNYALTPFAMATRDKSIRAHRYSIEADYESLRQFCVSHYEHITTVWAAAERPARELQEEGQDRERKSSRLSASGAQAQAPSGLRRPFKDPVS
jgi:hypothetical protein